MYYRIKGNKLLLRVLAKPNAKTSCILGLYQNALLVSLKAPPVDGKANQALEWLFRDLLKLRKSEIIILKGTNSRIKQIEIPYSEELLMKLNYLLASSS